MTTPVPATPAPPARSIAETILRAMPTPEWTATGTSAVLRCDECGVLTFDLKRLAEIHNCPRAGAFCLTKVEGLAIAAAPVPEDREEATGMDDDAQTRRYLWRMSNEIEGSELTLHWRQDAKVLRLTADRLVALAEENKRLRGDVEFHRGQTLEIARQFDAFRSAALNPEAPADAR